MTPRYVLAPEAAQDVFEIWLYIRDHSSVDAASQVESVILNKIAFLAANPRVGHYREDLTSERVRFYAVYSYLIVYRPETRPLQIACVLHGRQDVAGILKDRL